MKSAIPHRIPKKKATPVGLTSTELGQVDDRVVVSFDKYKEKLRGPKGDEGNKGEAGEKGPRGERGECGADGHRGDAGQTGRAGIPGADGRRGRIGRQGADGAVGSQGPRGEKGDKGDKGDPPEHQWEGAKLRFRMPNGAWGRFINLQGMTGGRGRAGQDGSGGFSVKEIWDEITLSGTDLIFSRNQAGSLGPDVTVDLSGLSAGGTWGSIAGTLSAQTDLQAELDQARSTRFFLGE